MIKLDTINYYKLQNDEFVGLQAEYVAFMEGIKEEESLALSLAAYKASMAKLTDHLKADYGETSSHAASRLNSERISAYVALHDSVKLLCKMSDADKVKIGTEYMAIFDAYGSPHSLKQTGVTRVIDAVIADFRARDKEELANTGVESWLSALEAKEAAFKNAAENRGEAKDTRVDAATLLYRAECLTNFNILMGQVRALAVHKNDPACIKLMNQINGEIALYKARMNARSESKKSSSESAKSETKSETATAETVTTEAVAAETVAVGNSTVTVDAVKDAA